MLRVEQGKGRKDRHAMHSPVQIPIAQAEPLRSFSRGFLSWRLSDAGRKRTPLVISRGWHPKLFTLASSSAAHIRFASP